MIILASAILLTICTSVFAGIPEDFNVKGATSDGVITTKLAKCTNTACEANVFIEAIANN
jgi:hypothetical protein